MRFFTFLLLLFCSANLCFGQTNSESLYKTFKPEFDPTICVDSARIKLMLLDQNNHLIRTQFHLVSMGDTIPLHLAPDELREALIPNGVQQIRIISGLGYNLTTAPLQFPAQTITEMSVKMIGAPVVIDNIFHDL